MALRENVTKVLKDLILPELQGLRSEVAKLGTRLDAVENRLTDFSARFQAIDQHLVDQSRRIDELRSEFTTRLDHQNARLDHQSARIDQLILQVAAVGQEVVALRQDREVVGDILRRVSRLEASAAA